MKWLTSAPANLMIMGEHSVVYGHNAIATAIDKRIYIEWQTRDDNKIIINSALAQYQTTLDNLEDEAKLQWVIACLNYFKPQLKHGLDIKITSEFDATLGLGSSAAVLAAMLGGLQFYLQQDLAVSDNFKIGLRIIKQIQQRGSGTDLAASLTGGMILFEPNQHKITKLPPPLKLNLIYSGYKTSTSKVLDLVQKHWQAQPQLLSSLYKQMGATTEQSFKALCKNDINSFYQLCNSYHGLMDSLGVNDLMLSRIIYETRNMPNISASKISGSGLGDCVLAIGELSISCDFINQLQPIKVKTSADGLLSEQL